MLHVNNRKIYFLQTKYLFIYSICHIGWWNINNSNLGNNFILSPLSINFLCFLYMHARCSVCMHILIINQCSSKNVTDLKWVITIWIFFFSMKYLILAYTSMIKDACVRDRQIKERERKATHKVLQWSS